MPTRKIVPFKRSRPAVHAAREQLEDALAYYRDRDPVRAEMSVREAYRLVDLYVGDRAA